MALSNSSIYNIYQGLNHNFLFNNDINSIHILLNLYDLENNITNIFPRYLSLNNLRKDISRLLKDRGSKHLIASNLGKLLHEDINRLELYLYLEGYKHGYLDNRLANNLENITIKYFSITDLYNIKYLYHFNIINDEVKKIKDKIYKKQKSENGNYPTLKNIVYNYTSNIIKSKIFSLNKYLDKQLEIGYDFYTAYIKEDNFLTMEELDNIYNKVERTISTNGYKTYIDAYWYGVNDRVLQRYI